MTEAVNIGKDGQFTRQALAKLEAMAKEGKTQASIAAFFRIPLKRFAGLLDDKKGENEARLAWERGRAFKEQDNLDRIQAAANGVETITEEFEDHPEHGRILVRTKLVVQSKGAAIQQMFLMKTQYGWNEKSDQAGTGNDSRVMIVLPKPMTQKEYFETLGITAPMDFSRPRPKDVTPAPAALPAPGRADDETIRARVRELTTPKVVR